MRKAEPVGSGRWRYTIFFPDGGRTQTYTSPPTTIEQIKGPLDHLTDGRFTPEIDFDLLNETLRLSTIFEYERLVSLSSSRINLEPYQVFAVHQVLSRFPHRYLIADDTGLGKTIEAGMILEELTARGRADRVLIVAPAAVAPQWKEELRQAFNRDYVFYDGPYLRQLLDKLPPEQNPWDREDRIITKLDLAKRAEIRAQLERTRWDVVIFDEAHKLSARRYGSKAEATQRYDLARALAERTDSLLLLSATPHNGDRYAFHALLTLLDEYSFPDLDSVTRSQVARVAIRRTKREILDETGKPVFVQRHVRTLPVEFTPAEEELYQAVTAYVAEGYNLAREAKNRAAGFLMVLFQKRMVSSIEAIRRSLERRLQSLERLRTADASQVALSPDEERRLNEYLEDPDSLSDAEREEIERRLESLPVFTHVDTEIAKLRELCQKANAIRVDTKADTLFGFLEELFREREEKVLVFTEYRDTLHYLERLARERGWDFATIHGEMSMLARKMSQRQFEESGTPLLFATDAAGEGLNLHWKCHLMVNYELPWNPNRIEQRIGRLHRYGQKRDVLVHNLFVTNTREDSILARLLERLEQIRADVPGEVHDVLGSLMEGVDLQELLMSALAENRPPEVTAEQAARAAEERAWMLAVVEEELLMDVRHYDHERALSLLRDARRVSATGEDLRRLAEAYLTSRGAKIRPGAGQGEVRISGVPAELQRPGVRPEYERATFDRAVARNTRPHEVDLIAFGHPLFDAIIAECGALELRGVATVKRIPSERWAGLTGILATFILEFTDGMSQTVAKRFHQVFVDLEGRARPEVLSEVPVLGTTGREPPVLPPSLHARLGDLVQCGQTAVRLAREAAATLEEEIQAGRIRLVARMREDLATYAGVKEAQIKHKLSEARRRIREVQGQMTLSEDDAERRRLENTLRLREYDLQEAERELERLRAKVQKRSEELGNMEIVVDEEPRLASLAVVEFVSPKEER
ncbi:DEAD/DEAH box helicase family protein [Candidatus Bipolaricaulota bacterium]|nr:DEAD/DEAH box helicase family protein [Candidatus Bipolaricaulota bacterium]